MSNHTEFFLNRSGAVVQLECLEIAHPSFSQTFYIVRNATAGLTVTHEDSTTHDYIYVPVQIDRGNTSDDLDQKLSITLGELGRILPDEIDAVIAGEYADVRPTVRYRVYRSDNLSAPIETLKTLHVESMSRDASGTTTFVAQAAKLNSTKTGWTYSPELFPSIRGIS
jgi:hypothetical protein